MGTFSVTDGDGRISRSKGIKHGIWSARIFCAN